MHLRRSNFGIAAGAICCYTTLDEQCFFHNRALQLSQTSLLPSKQHHLQAHFKTYQLPSGDLAGPHIGNALLVLRSQLSCFFFSLGTVFKA